MPQNKKGSILLYTLFLTSFLVLFFISFQGEIEKKLVGAESLGQNIEEISNTRDALISLKNSPQGSQDIGVSGNMTLISLSQSGNTFTDSIDGTGSFEYRMTSTGGANTISLDITGWWPLRYVFAAFNSGAESSATLVSSWVVTAHTPLPLSSTLEQSILVVEGLGGHTKYTLDASSATIIPEKSSYKQVRDINGYSKTAWLYEVVHFLPKTRTNFPYESLGMYLKQ